MLITPSPVATTPVIQRLSREYVETDIINLNGQSSISYIFSMKTVEKNKYVNAYIGFSRVSRIVECCVFSSLAISYE